MSASSRVIDHHPRAEKRPVADIKGAVRRNIRKISDAFKTTRLTDGKLEDRRRTASVGMAARLP